MEFGFQNLASIEKGADRFLNGITTIPSIPGGMVNDLNAISGSMLSIGNSIRENPFMKEHLPFLGNLVASPIDMATGLFKMGTEIGTMPLQMLLNPGAITTQGFPLPGFGEGLGTFGLGSMGMLGAANHALTNVRAIGTEVIGSVFDTGKAIVNGAFDLGVMGVNLGWETLAAPFQMGANLWNGKPATDGL